MNFFIWSNPIPCPKYECDTCNLQIDDTKKQNLIYKDK